MIQIEKYFDIFHSLKFIFLVVLFYYFSVIFNGIVSPEGDLYSPVLDNYFNYIAWMRSIIMYAAIILAYQFGTESYVAGSQLINIRDAFEVNIWFPCLGIGVISFWLAFIVTNTGNWKRKLLWSVIGIIAICWINTWRITLLLIALDNNWTKYRLIDHHDLFNITAYAFIILMMYLYGRTKSFTTA